jgi:hypothetical protein
LLSANLHSNRKVDLKENQLTLKYSARKVEEYATNNLDWPDARQAQI